ncbi:MAG TPA: alpha/beta hydrolase-fold protein [Chloroflexia bacterium]|nr:alpha/beta hydrolase-fold protein [Chloroflexia bacterium]
MQKVQCLMASDNIPRSPRIVALARALANHQPHALADFWSQVTAQGTPLVEPDPHDSASALVTFLWRGTATTRNVVVVGGVADQDVAEDFIHHQMAQLPGTDLWYRTYRTSSAAHFVYRLSPNDALIMPADVTNWREREATFQPDPLNQHPYQVDEDEPASIARLPGVIAQPWLGPPAVPVGSIETHTWHGTDVNAERTVWIYPPPSTSRHATPSHLLLLLDGPSYVQPPFVPMILDHLLAAGRVPPTLCVNVGFANDGGSSREHELACNPAFADALANELVPWLRERYQCHAAADATIIGGASLSGLAAAYTALRHPQVFGNVLSQYGYFSWAPPQPDEPCEYTWLAQRYLDSPTLPIRFSLTVGLFDSVAFLNHKQRPSLLLANRHFRDILRAKGYHVTYREVYSGHDELNKRYSFADALLALLDYGSEVR